MTELNFIITFIILILIIYVYFRFEAISEKQINEKLVKREYFYKTSCNVRFIYGEDTLEKFRMSLYAYDFGILLVRDIKQVFGPYSILLAKHQSCQNEFSKVKMFGLVDNCIVGSNTLIIHALVEDQIFFVKNSKEFIIEFDDRNDLIMKLIEFTNK